MWPKRRPLNIRLIRNGAEIVYQAEIKPSPLFRYFVDDRLKHQLILFYKNEFYCFKLEYDKGNLYHRLDVKYDGNLVSFHRSYTSYVRVKNEKGELVDKVYKPSIKALIKDESNKVIKWYSTNSDRRKKVSKVNRAYIESIAAMDKFLLNKKVDEMLSDVA